MEEIWAFLQGDEETRQARRAFSRVGWALAALMVLQVAVQYPVLALVERMAPSWLAYSGVSFVIAALASYGAAFPAALLILRTLPGEGPGELRDLSRQTLGVLWLVSLGWLYMANLVTLTLVGALETARGAPIFNPVEQMADQPVVLNLLLGCVLAPAAEELLFRRTLMDRLRPWGEGFALVVSALAFALVHGNLYQMLYAFSVGLVFGGVYLHTGRVRYTMLLHAGVNAVSAGLAPAARLLGQGADVCLSLLVLGSMICAFQWTLHNRDVLDEAARRAGWGDGETWGQLVVNPGMTGFCLTVIAAIWLSMYR